MLKEILKIHRSSTRSVALVLDSPQSGNEFPDDFGAAVSMAQLRGAEDVLVHELYANAPLHDARLQGHLPHDHANARLGGA